jgi:phosphatidylserine/phosphatidylglycerophosphate/cardiolipin synthase-like enzyme
LYGAAARVAVRALVVLAAVACLLTPVAAAVPADAEPGVAAASSSPDLVATVPNPVADGDAGESVTLAVGEPANLSAYALADGESTVRLPNQTATGRVTLTAEPTRVRDRTDHPVVAVDLPALSNAGERLRLVRGNRTVSTLRYEDAPEGERYRAGKWRPVGATDHPVLATGSGTARAFVLPDAPGPPVAAIENATDRVLLAGYTLTSARVTDALAAAAGRGADVRVLLEGGPVGGATTAQATRLDRLVDAGVRVRIVDGPRTRYAYHHAKYAVADDRAVVLTENWKAAGTGGASSRGWGVTVTDAALVADLAELFRGDFGFAAARPWAEYRRGRSFETTDPAEGSFPARFAPTRVRYERASLLVAPDNAESALVARLRNASDSVRVVQVSVGAESDLLAATVDAARRGVEVRLLLSGAWYTREANAALAERLNGLAERESLPLEVRLADPSGYGKVHAKGVVVDDTVVLGSLNWNEHAGSENREVLVALSGGDAAAYYRAVFDADWRASGSGGVGRLPSLGVVAALAVAALACLLAARRLRFE